VFWSFDKCFGDLTSFWSFDKLSGALTSFFEL
jgi:hypothetical protein